MGTISSPDRPAGRPGLAVLHARGFGQDHYWAELWPHLAPFCRPEYVCMAGPAGDASVAPRLDPVHEIVRPEEHGNVELVARHLRERGVRVVVPQVATDLCRHRRYFVRLLDRLRADGAAIVATLHNVLPHDPIALPPRELSALYDRFDAFLVGNAPQRALLERHFDTAGRPVREAPHGPYLGLDRGRHDRASARAALGLPADGPGVLFFGNLRANKGLDVLAAAAPRLRAARPDLWIYVSATIRLLEDGARTAARAALRELARRDGLHVRTGPVPSPEIEAVFRACDVVALPYRTLSQSGILAVARAFRRRVVASEPFRHAAPLAPGEGRLVPVGDAAALAEAVLEVLAEPGEAPPPDATPWERNAAALREACAAVAGRARPTA